MFKKLQLVVLGVVVLQAAGVSAMDQAPKSPRKMTDSPRKLRNQLSCSQEARLSDSGDFTAVQGMKRSLEVRKENRNTGMMKGAYYLYPGGPSCDFYQANGIDHMKPLYSDCP